MQSSKTQLMKASQPHESTNIDITGSHSKGNSHKKMFATDTELLDWNMVSVHFYR